MANMVNKANMTFTLSKRVDFLWTILTYLLVFVTIFPILWMILTGFKQEVDAVTPIPMLIFQPTLDQYNLVMQSGFASYLFNSFAASFTSTVLALALGVPAAYSMVFQMRKRSEQDMLFFVLSTRFMPFAAILVPLFVILTRLNLLDNLFILILVYTSMNLPLVIWMARSYFLELPYEVLEQARLDGCADLQTLLRIVVPMSIPGLAATALLAIIFAWNDFFFAVTLTFTESPTLPIMVATFTTNEGLFLAKVSALATAIILLPVLFGMYAQRHLVRGLTGGALK